MADYRDVDPKIGTLEDFDEMMAEFKKVGIKVFVDIVPNHTSDDHEWFQEALRSPKGSNARARYHFWDGQSRSHCCMAPLLMRRKRAEQGPAAHGLDRRVWR